MTNKFLNMSAKEVSELSHDDQWENVSDGEEMIP